MPIDVTTLWLARCGDSLWQRDARLQGQADIPLSAEGRATLESALAQLNVACGAPRGAIAGAATVVLHPPDEAASESAAIVARALGGRPRRAEALAEPDLGLFTGLTIAEVRERFPTRHRQWEDEPMSLVPPDGEPLAGAQERILTALAEACRRHRGKTFAAVLHPLALGIVRCALARRPANELWRQIEGRPRVEEYLLPGDSEELLRAAAEAIA
ncbi:MAG TPA: histidine phosphatase family protein [Phycisphaerales bacterium]|nr:histidine phosphatase family protein [Phycisphaerales bacterium]HMP37755.1 histidine phosphatase family protein [Phycisphaerales bacterium]